MKTYYDDDTSSLKSGLYLLAIILAFVALIMACFNEDDNVDQKANPPVSHPYGKEEPR